MFKVRITNFEDPRAVKTIVHTTPDAGEAREIAESVLSNTIALWPTKVEYHGQQIMVFSDMGNPPYPLMAVIEVIAPTSVDYGSCPGAPKASDYNTRPRAY